MNQCCDTDTSLSVRAEMFFQMSVSVHSHFCISLVRCFRVQRKGHFIILVSLVPCVAAFGVDVVACGVPQPLSDPDLRPTFAPKRQGKAESAYRMPRLRPSFGQQKGIGRPMPCRVGNDRSIPNPSITDFCVLKDTARYVSSYSKPCGLLPQALPLKGEGGFLSEVGKPVSTCGAYAGSRAYAVTPLNP